METISPVTRIAPSPTGFMHVGTARTALFNWLFARARGGKFLLRIEDTDRVRSTPEATQAILNGMDWLGLEYDGEAVSQFEGADRHRAIVHRMLANGTAYKCFATSQEVAAFREQARTQGKPTLYVSPWRDVPPEDHPDAAYVVRLRAPQEGETIIDDLVQGPVKFSNQQLDDMVLLRSDGTPVYMLAVVVDDYEMGVTHVIRGDDHLNNAARQSLIYRAMGWPLPVYAHIPLIHGSDGKKLSKRHGALGVEEYRAMGYPAVALRNYLLRLGWSHGDDEFFTDAQALERFDLAGVGKAPARFDFKKLDHISRQHISGMEDADLLAGLEVYLAAANEAELSSAQRESILRAMYCLKDRARTYAELYEKAAFVVRSRPIVPDEKARAHLDEPMREYLAELTPHLQHASWERVVLEKITETLTASAGIKFGRLAGGLRAVLAGKTVTPSVFDMMLVLGRDETIARLKDACAVATTKAP